MVSVQKLGEPTRLLYAEDDQDTRDMICFALEQESFEVVCPDNPQEFINRAKAEKWDVFMLDNWMPGKNGVEICKEIRKFDSVTPIVFYSAAAYEIEKKKALDCGAQAYITKPASLDELAKRLRSTIHLQSSTVGTI